ncbi:Serine carboxypeptidase-like 49 [Linum perenne]
MADSNSFPLRVFLVLSLILCSRAAEAYSAMPNSNFPSVQAEKFIRDLNLFPNQDVNIVQGHGVAAPGKKIVEKPLRFPNLVGDDDLESAVEDLGHHAGYFNIEHSYAAKSVPISFSFLPLSFFSSRNSKDDPVVIWLTGGPGCSSELAIFYENGPFSIADNMTLVWNKYGWDQASNLIYVDQPTGTGFSYSTDRRDIRHNEDGVSNDLYDFLQAFFTEHPELAENDFYITGESYAGHYIPAFASRVHRGNKNNEGIHINLKGFAIGNGLTDPAVQYKAYPDFALQNGIIKESQYKLINKVVPVCELAIKLCGTDGTVSCMASYFVCNGIFTAIMAIAGNINYYDIRKQCEGSLCYDFSNMEKFLNLKNVRESLGVGDIDFVSCSPTVYEAMLVDWMRNLEVGIPALLEDGVNMLIYAGEYDLICNWLGNSRWVHAMEWSGQKEFVSSPELSFEVDGSEAGKLKTHGPLSFLKVHNAGHMVPMDQPKAALEMLKRWTRGELSYAPTNISNPEKLVAEI